MASPSVCACAVRGAPWRTRSDRFSIPSGRPWQVLFTTRECDFGALGNALAARGSVAPCPRDAELGNLTGDDVPGYAVRTFSSPQASLGRHVLNSRLEGSTCPPSNRRGCYAVTFTVTRGR